MTRLAWIATILLTGLAFRIEAQVPPTVFLHEGEVSTWRGLTPEESAGSAGPSFLYPAAGPEGLVAAVLTHAFISNTARKLEREAMQKRADEALIPFQSALTLLDLKTLANQLNGNLDRFEPSIQGIRSIQMTPSFSLNADHSAFMLDTRVAIDRSVEGGARTPPFSALIRVVSSPALATDSTAYWLADNALALHREVLDMLSHSIDITLDHTVNATTQPEKTHRYQFGGTTRMERARQVAGGCNRKLLFTLRDSWLSVPLPAGEASSCAENYRITRLDRP